MEMEFIRKLPIPMDIKEKIDNEINDNPNNSEYEKINSGIIYKYKDYIDGEFKDNDNVFIDPEACSIKSKTINQFNQNITSKNDNSLSSVKDDSFNSMRNIANKKHLYNSALYMNKFRIRNTDLNFGKNLSSLSPTNKDDNNNDKKYLNNINNDINDINDNDEEMKIIEDKSKKEFLRTYNRKNYMDFLKNKYRFIEGKHNEEKEYKETVEIMKRHNMFKSKPKNDFLKNQIKDVDKFIFFKKIENDNNKLNTSSEIKIKKREKKNKKFLLSPRTNRKILNNSVNQIFNIFLKN